MEENSNYHIIDREDWKLYRDRTKPAVHFELTEEELDQIVSLNDVLTMKDAREIYLPLTQLLSIYIDQYWDLIAERNQFLGIDGERTPFIVGISGSVAVGKSTIARLLQLLLSQSYPELEVDLLTTDGFLYPNQVLKEKGIMDRKGFPESYDMEKLYDFLTQVKKNVHNIKAPVYSHEVYDVLPDQYDILEHPDILILEGINVLQVPPHDNLFVSDFTDLSIYVDADTEMIESWYMQRFEMLVEKAKDQPDNYHHQYSLMSRAERDRIAEETWRNINLVNLNEYILPTRSRADIVIHKIENHYIDAIWMKKY